MDEKIISYEEAFSRGYFIKSKKFDGAKFWRRADRYRLPVAWIKPMRKYATITVDLICSDKLYCAEGVELIRKLAHARGVMGRHWHLGVYTYFDVPMDEAVPTMTALLKIVQVHLVPRRLDQSWTPGKPKNFPCYH